MPLLIPLAAMVTVALGLAVASSARWLSRRDHRCDVRTRPSCRQCQAVLRGEGLGGHMVCACGDSSPHLTGVDLLRWRAGHHGEELPALPDAGAGAGAGARAEARADAQARPDAGAQLDTGFDPVEEAEGEAFVALLEEMGEAERRAVVRSRRNPDPVTPQVLREAALAGDAHGAGTDDAGVGVREAQGRAERPPGE